MSATAAASAARNSLSRFLTTPSKVAHALDWRKASGGCILSMSIRPDFVDLAVASHPDSEDAPVPLPSIPIQTQVVNNQRVISPAVAEELGKIMNAWNVCGMVVSWPVQEEGWVGAPCGRVLFTLDQLIQSQTGAGVINANRKVCLWNESHNEYCEDNWGRCPLYAKTSEKTIHYASKEQYQAPRTLAADVWNDFCRAHWPALYNNNNEQESATTTASSRASWSRAAVATKTPPASRLYVNTAWLDSYESTAAYSKASL